MHGTYNIKNYKIQIKYSCTLISQHGQICMQSLGAGYGMHKTRPRGWKLLKIMCRTKLEATFMKYNL